MALSQSAHPSKQQAQLVGSWSVPAQYNTAEMYATGHHSTTHRLTHHAYHRPRSLWNPAHHRRLPPVHYRQQPQRYHNRGGWIPPPPPPPTNATMPSFSRDGQFPHGINEASPFFPRMGHDENNVAHTSVEPNYMKSYPAKRGERWRPTTHLPANVSKISGISKKRRNDTGSCPRLAPMLREVLPMAILKNPKDDGTAIAEAEDSTLVDTTSMGLDFLTHAKESTPAPLWVASQFDAWVATTNSSGASPFGLVSQESFELENDSCVLPRPTIDILLDIVSEDEETY